MRTLSYIIQSTLFITWFDEPFVGLTLEGGLRKLEEVARANPSRRFRLIRRITSTSDSVIKRAGR